MEMEKIHKGFTEIVLSDERENKRYRKLYRKQLRRNEILQEKFRTLSDAEVTPREQTLIDENERLIEKNDTLERQFYTLLQKLEPVENSKTDS